MLVLPAVFLDDLSVLFYPRNETQLLGRVFFNEYVNKFSADNVQVVNTDMRTPKLTSVPFPSLMKNPGGQFKLNIHIKWLM